MHLPVAWITSKMLPHPLLFVPTHPQQEKKTNVKLKWAKTALYGPHSTQKGRHVSQNRDMSVSRWNTLKHNPEDTCLTESD